MLPDGRVLFGANEGTLIVRNVSSGDSRVLTRHTGGISALAVLPDGRVLSGSWDALALWDLETGDSRVLTPRTGWVNALAVLPDGRVLSGSRDGSVIVWDVARGALIAAFFADAAITCVAATQTHILAGSANGAVHILCLRQ